MVAESRRRSRKSVETWAGGWGGTTVSSEEIENLRCYEDLRLSPTWVGSSHETRWGRPPPVSPYVNDRLLRRLPLLRTTSDWSHRNRRGREFLLFASIKRGGEGIAKGGGVALDRISSGHDPRLLGPVTPLWRMFVWVGKEILKVLPQAMKTLSGTFPGEAVRSVAAWFKARSWDRRGPRCLSMPLVVQRQLHRKFIGDIYPLADQSLRPSFPPE